MPLRVSHVWADVSFVTNFYYITVIVMPRFSTPAARDRPTVADRKIEHRVVVNGWALFCPCDAPKLERRDPWVPHWRPPGGWPR